MLTLRSSLFWIGAALSAVLVFLLALFTVPLPFALRYRVISCWARFNLWWLKICCRLNYQLEGAENLPQRSAIVLCKHQSTWETLALQDILPPHTWILKRELLRIPVFGWGLALLNPVAIDRTAGRKALDQLIEQGSERLDAGCWLVIFPEGTRRPPGQKGSYRIGGAMLAHKSGHPVVPVAHNAGSYWPRHGFTLKPGTITIAIGPVIESTDRSATEINELTEAWIENRMKTLERPAS
ncbi:MAG: 1-acyl-sn-glycerol-3-phosphate acyltransferase [Gammaproteobacteria bacterium]|nr:1-acyl-sn-glycerol-3-phosphate acyltransferase [Gammaproteobacteria bacterium]